MFGDTYEYQYLFVFIFLLIAIVFPLLPIVLAHFVAPKKPSPSKQSTYECGLESKGDSWIQYHVRYYIFALIFVIFDIETILIFPWAVAFKQLGLFAFVEMIIFILLLAFGLFYEWKKGMLEWE